MTNIETLTTFGVSHAFWPQNRHFRLDRSQRCANRRHEIEICWRFTHTTITKERLAKVKSKNTTVYKSGADYGLTDNVPYHPQREQINDQELSKTELSWLRVYFYLFIYLFLSTDSTKELKVWKSMTSTPNNASFRKRWSRCRLNTITKRPLFYGLWIYSSTTSTS